MFHSLLFAHPAQPAEKQDPQMLRDLHLDRILERFLKLCPWGEALFLSPLGDPEQIRFRQEIFRDLQDPDIRRAFAGFSGSVRELEQSLRKLRDRDLLDASRFLYLEKKYTRTLEDLQQADRSQIRSPGLSRFLSDLDALLESARWQERKEEALRLSEGFRKLRFCLLIKDGRFKLRPYEDQKPLDREVRELFSRFQPREAPRSSGALPEVRGMHHIDEGILSLLSQSYPDLFRDLEAFAAGVSLPDAGVGEAAEELGFYLAWEQLLEPLRQAGLRFCLPQIGGGDQFCRDGFALSLALRLQQKGESVVPNDFSLSGEERILVVTGPNQGGKTTFARYFGQCYYLAGLGVPIPGSCARLRTADRIYTHFNREEDLNDLSGRLQDDIRRLRDILQSATDRSIVIINEIYASTTLEDAISLGSRMMEDLGKLGAAGVCVTFLDELSRCGPHAVSMMATVSQSAARSYRVIRRPADGLAYAMYLAEKYGLSYEALGRRLESCR